MILNYFLTARNKLDSTEIDSVTILQDLTESSLKGTVTLMISMFYQKELYEP